jgi:ABC-2 type transport system permease protein
MSGVLFRRAIADRRRWLIGWSIGIAAFVVINIAFWPSFRDQSDELNDMIEQMPESIRALFGMGEGVDPFSPVGYLSAQVYTFALPLLLLIAGIGAVASIAGDEERGLLETTFTLPITRRRILVERWAAVVVLTTILSGVGLVSTLISARAVDLEVGTTSIVWASVGVTVLTWAVSGLGLVVGAATGRRGLAITVASVLAVASYLITSLADAGIAVFETLEPLSVFTHYDVLATLANGAPPWSLLVLAAVVVLATLAAETVIDRRDLRAA